jgi:site-specific DNA recombinase
MNMLKAEQLPPRVLSADPFKVLMVDPYKVALYIRWSTDEQGDGTTLEVQKENCEHYVLSQGWQVNPDLIFIDDGWSGGNLNRPAMTRMRKMIQDGKIDCVVVYKLDRR